MTLLHLAVLSGHCNLSSIVLQRGTNANTKDTGGITSINHSIQKSHGLSSGIHVDNKLLLLQWGAKVDEKMTSAPQHPP